jgi:hypothetical protein
MKKCVWVRPALVARIEFLEWPERDHLRHSKFVGCATTRIPRSVVKEHSGERSRPPSRSRRVSVEDTGDCVPSFGFGLSKIFQRNDEFEHYLRTVTSPDEARLFPASP